MNEGLYYAYVSLTTVAMDQGYEISRYLSWNGQLLEMHLYCYGRNI